jgi:hypothetical protein
MEGFSGHVPIAAIEQEPGESQALTRRTQSRLPQPEDGLAEWALNHIHGIVLF